MPLRRVRDLSARLLTIKKLHNLKEVSLRKQLSRVLDFNGLLSNHETHL